MGKRDYRVLWVCFPLSNIKKQSQKMFLKKESMINHKLVSYKHIFQT